MARRKRETPQVDEEYLKAYYDNEEDANIQMSRANAFSGGIMLILWIAYLTRFFTVLDSVMPLINTVFPIGILILLTPLLYTFFFKNRLRKAGYKYFVIFSFIFVVTAINIIIPKHGLLAWALCIIITNHYYNPKVGIVTFISVLILSLLCIYLGMFFGEYDPNILGNGVIIDGKIVYLEDFHSRLEMLHRMIQEGENRYLKAFLYYYLPRSLILTLIFFVSNALNLRTYKLLVSEINVNNQQARTKTELDVAKEIQLTTLPTSFVTNSDIEIQAELKAAKEVGGDFYDYIVLDDDHIAIVIGDVSGKGIPAAMFMMKTITCFKNFISLDKTPSEILKLVNKTIYQGNESQMFATCFLAIINTRNGEMNYANAGHNPPIVGQKMKYQYLKCNSGFLLGVMPDAFVKDEKYIFNKGDTITLYTDGITEARNNNKDFYGEERLINLFNKKIYSSLLELHHQLKDEIADFVDGAEQSDDITYLTLKYHGDKYIYEERIYDIPKTNTQQIMDFLEEFAIKYKFETSFIKNLLVVGDELISNVVKYAYEGGEGEIFLRLLYNLDQKEFILTIIDQGKEFNPFLVNNTPLEGDVSNTKEGGLGILIVKTLMSEYAYDRIRGKNIVIVKKRFEK